MKPLVTTIVLLYSTHALAHQGHTDEAAWKACEGEQVGATCSYDRGEYVATGTCQTIEDHLMCVRNRPLTKRTDDAEKSLAPFLFVLLLGARSRRVLSSP